MKIIFLIIGIFLFMTNLSFTADHKLDRKQIYELKEKCSKRAEEVFKRDYNSSSWQEEDGSHVTVNFRNHYNRKVNKCFMLTAYSSFNVKEKTLIRTEDLIDINENRKYGTSTILNHNKPIECVILDKICNSKNEWNRLIKPYMEE